MRHIHSLRYQNIPAATEETLLFTRYHARSEQRTAARILEAKERQASLTLDLEYQISDNLTDPVIANRYQERHGTLPKSVLDPKFLEILAEYRVEWLKKLRGLAPDLRIGNWYEANQSANLDELRRIDNQEPGLARHADFHGIGCYWSRVDRLEQWFRENNLHVYAARHNIKDELNVWLNIRALSAPDTGKMISLEYQQFAIGMFERFGVDAVVWCDFTKTEAEQAASELPADCPMFQLAGL